MRNEADKLGVGLRVEVNLFQFIAKVGRNFMQQDMVCSASTSFRMPNYVERGFFFSSPRERERRPGRERDGVGALINEKRKEKCQFYEPAFIL